VKWRCANRDKRAATQARRAAAKAQQSPAWLTETQHREILAFYTTAKNLSQSTGVPHEVDHIVPLRGRGVRGLHVPWNLQVLTEADNTKKGNRFVR
jgi:5-methylcytosine-specific restriction endonuclease McrA